MQKWRNSRLWRVKADLTAYGVAQTQMHYVYVLKSLKDEKRYVGLTNNISRCLAEHNDGKVPATKGRRPLVLLRVEEFQNRSEAAKREKYLKSGVGKNELDNLVSL